MNLMQKDQRIAALERLIQQYEKCRRELLAVEHEVRASSTDEQIDDILAFNEQLREAADRALHVAYARLEREQSRAVARHAPPASASVLRPLSAAI
jgi:hypothetical protein